jgi:CRISPR/Cas system CSM-associated protein Csm5 (group 7 of RAMP superfamily)
VSSHYSHAKSPFRKYLPPGSSVKGAFHAYVEWLKEK